MFIFDEEKHEYFMDGKRFPSVTEILKDTGLIEENRYFKKSENYYKTKGKYMHEAIKMYLDGNLDENSLDPQLNIKGFKKFLKASDINIVGYEQPMYEEQYMFAGTPDIWGKINGKMILIDIKTGVPAKWHPIQLAAYERLLVRNLPPKDANIGCANLYLSDSNYCLRGLSEKDKFYGWSVFVSALTIYNWKRRTK